jgi:hypothetical protein
MAIVPVDRDSVLRKTEKINPREIQTIHTMIDVARDVLVDTARSYNQGLCAIFSIHDCVSGFGFYDENECYAITGYISFFTDRAGRKIGTIGVWYTKPEYMKVAIEMRRNFERTFGRHPLAGSAVVAKYR